jgi:hypothetical protein
MESLAVLSLILFPWQVMACSCTGALSPCYEVAKVFDSVLDHGSYVTLEVKTVFTKGGDDDDDKNGKAKDDDNDDAGAFAAGKLFSVWTPSFDCGVEFQTGETYLVYASMDEDSDTVETDICMGTRRLSDAGADLPYRSFVQIDPKESGHLDGFVTSDSAARANPPESDTIPSPVGGILIELKSDDAVRYATSGNDGRFVFDGLADDSYKLTGYTAEYPDPQQLVAGAAGLRMERTEADQRSPAAKQLPAEAKPWRTHFACRVGTFADARRRSEKNWCREKSRHGTLRACATSV